MGTYHGLIDVRSPAVIFFPAADRLIGYAVRTVAGNRQIGAGPLDYPVAAGAKVKFCLRDDGTGLSVVSTLRVFSPEEIDAAVEETRRIARCLSDGSLAQISLQEASADPIIAEWTNLAVNEFREMAQKALS